EPYTAYSHPVGVASGKEGVVKLQINVHLKPGGKNHESSLDDSSWRARSSASTGRAKPYCSGGKYGTFNQLSGGWC
ncbi:hypothetical protein, partial [Nostoc linckia]